MGVYTKRNKISRVKLMSVFFLASYQRTAKKHLE